MTVLSKQFRTYGIFKEHRVPKMVYSEIKKYLKLVNRAIANRD